MPHTGGPARWIGAADWSPLVVLGRLPHRSAEPARSTIRCSSRVGMGVWITGRYGYPTSRSAVRVAGGAASFSRHYAGRVLAVTNRRTLTMDGQEVLLVRDGASDREITTLVGLNRRTIETDLVDQARQPYDDGVANEVMAHVI